MVLHVLHKKLYHIEFHRSLYDVSNDYYNISLIDKEFMQKIKIYGFLDYVDDFHSYNMYILTTKDDIDNYLDILDQNLIPCICKDISKNVINNRINLDYKLFRYLTELNIIQYKRFTLTIDSWIKSNLNLDLILDIINEMGIESLRLIDLEFLKNIK